MDFGRLPVMPRGRDVPVIATNKWKKSENSLIKTYKFISNELRNDFVRQLLIHEENVGHNATMSIQTETVTLTLQTHGIDQVTELDKEYARAADELYKDVVYSLSNDR
jgi:pterin-4a-carbinolamine dehydratase